MTTIGTIATFFGPAILIFWIALKFAKSPEKEEKTNELD